MNPDRVHRLVSARLGLNVVEWGRIDNPALFLLHGGRDHCRSWDGVAAAFATDFRVIAADLRGHGDSDWANDGHYSSADMVFDMKSIFDQLELPPCLVIGHSLGGNVVTRFAGLYPERVAKLVNVEGLGFSGDPADDDDLAAQLKLLRAWAPRHAVTSAWQPRRFRDLASAVARLRETNARLSAAQAYHLVASGTHRHDDGSVSFKYDPGIMGFAPFDWSLAMRHALWRQVTCPMLAVYGCESWAKNPRDDGRLDFFRNARLIMFERAGHWVQHDRQVDFIAATRAFFAE